MSNQEHTPEPAPFTCPECPDFATYSFEEYIAHINTPWADLPANQEPPRQQPDPDPAGEQSTVS